MIHTIETTVKPNELVIKGQSYAVATYTPEADGYRNGVRLEKRDGTVYDVVDGPHGAECDCPDFETRHRGLPTAGCKHVRACRDAGLLVSADPTPRKPLLAVAPKPVPAYSYDLAAKVADQIARGEKPDAEELATVRRHLHLTADPYGPTLGSTDPAPTCCAPDEPAPCTACTGEPAAAPVPDNLTIGEGDGRREDAGDILGPAEPIDDFEDDWDESDSGEDWPTFTPPPPHDDDLGELLTLDAWVDREADRYLLLGHGAGRLIADQLATLARSIRFVNAATPDGFLARTAALDAGRWEDQGEPDA